MPTENAEEHIPDIFISYAHADDDVPHGARFGWVTTFVEELKKQLRRQLGGSGAGVWMDFQLAANDQVTATLEETVRRSRTLVLFMSRGYSRSPWCQRELGRFLERNQTHKHKESVFIVELYPTERDHWHPRLRELTPIRFWREGPDQIPELLGIPVPKPDQDDLYWRNLNRLAHLIAKHLDNYSHQPEPGADMPAATAPATVTAANSTVWIAEPTDDVFDQWESLSEAVCQMGADVRPLGLDTYPRGSEAEFLAGVRADLGSADLFVQLLGQSPKRPPKGGTVSMTALQTALADEWATRRRLEFLRWRSRDVELEKVKDEDYRHLLTGAVACGFEEFRQRVLGAVKALSSPPPVDKIASAAEAGLAICISANKSDHDLGLRVRDILFDLGAEALTAPTEPTPEQTPTDFNAQLDEVMTGSEGVIIVYGQTAPAWVQAQYVRARKALAQRRAGVWGALLDGPPRDKPEHGITSRNLMMLDCRDGPQRQHIARFVDALRGAGHV